MRSWFRYAVGALWSFVIFRYVVLQLVRVLPAGPSRWIAVNTPLAFSMRDLALRDEDWESACQWADLLRGEGEL